jgi:hypothetical protein
MKDIAGMVPRIIKALTKLPSDRKANILKIKTVDEKQLLASAIILLKERLNAEVSVFDEEDQNRYDPKQRAAMAMPYQPAIFVE